MQFPALMVLDDVHFTHHHLSSDPLTLDSNTQPLVVFALSVQTHWEKTQKGNDKRRGFHIVN